MEGRNDDPDSIREAEEVRYRTLTQMEKVLRVLVDRHGARSTIGEMLAIYAAMDPAAWETGLRYSPEPVGVTKSSAT